MKILIDFADRSRVSAANLFGESVPDCFDHGSTDSSTRLSWLQVQSLLDCKENSRLAAVDHIVPSSIRPNINVDVTP